MVSRLTADTTQIKSAVGASVSIALRNLVLFVGGAVMMVVTSPRLSLFVLAAIPVIVLPLVGFGRAVRRRWRTAQDTLADASGYAGELIGAMRTLQAFTNERLATARFGAAVLEAYEAARGATSARRADRDRDLPGVLQRRGGAVGRRAGRAGGTHHRRPARQFVLYAVFAAGGLGEFSQVWGEIAQASGAAERLFEILGIEPQIKAPAQPVAHAESRRAARWRFRDVRFAYPTRPEAPVLDGLSFKVKPGEKLALVGPSGAGKSTIFHLILRFYDPLSGTVTFDGVRLTDADPAELRANIALVPQDAVVFAASVRENIRFGRPDASDAEIEQAAEAAHPRPNSSSACRKASTPKSASAASRCRAASASASPLRAPFCARRRCCCSMRRRPRSMPKARRWCSRRSNG